ncbi:hypothetical protein IPL68_02700 [Candidatus Saccharibacteria bacterium]|nr:MAG: hypothetical protein IPL68_02700 [Candidatus Saccharibacteria bacterium]
MKKVAELPANQEPLSLSQDCTPTQIPNGSGTIDACAYKTPLGTIVGGKLIDGPKGSLSTIRFTVAMPYQASQVTRGCLLRQFLRAAGQAALCLELAATTPHS